MQKYRSYLNAGVFAGNNLLASGIAAIAGIIQSRWVSPDTLGEFRQYFILSTYFYIPLIFVHDGFMRQFPILIGKGQTEKAHELASVVKWWYTRTTALFVLFFLILSLYYTIDGNFKAAAGWFVQIFVVILNIYGGYLSTLYRSNKEFLKLSHIRLTANTGLLVSLVFVYFFGFFGLAIRNSISNILSIGLQQRFLPVKVRSKLDVSALWENAKISLPLSIPGYINTSFLTASILSVILLSNDKKTLGMYTFAMFIYGFGHMMVNSFNQILNVKLLTAWGKHENSIQVLKILWKPMLLTFLAACLFYLMAYNLVDPVINLMTPKYAEAIPATRILLAKIPLLALSAPLGIFKSGLWYKEYYSIATIQFLSTVVLVFLMRSSLNGICFALVIASAIYLAAGYFLLMSRILRDQKM